MSESAPFKLHPTQIAAIEGCLGILKSKNGDREAILAGAAGTGKSTCAKAIAKAWGGKVIYLAPTGKAACRLTETSGYQAKTIHSAIFGQVEEEKVKDEVTKKTTSSKLNFNDLHPPEGADSSTLIIVDESSMIGIKLATQLREVSAECGAALLFMGDHEQLEPVGDKPGVNLNGTPFKLTKVYRQKEGSPALDLATRIREGGVNDAVTVMRNFERYGENCNVLDTTGTKDVASWFVNQLNEYPISEVTALTLSNKTRQWVNNDIRKKLGFKYKICIGDRLLCGFNCGTVFNGEVGTVVKVFTDKKLSAFIGSQVCRAEILFDGRETPNIVIVAVDLLSGVYTSSGVSENQANNDFWAKIIGTDDDAENKAISIENEQFFNSNEGIQLGITAETVKQWRNELKHRAMRLTYGYCLTVHKAQGSQWKAVGVTIDAGSVTYGGKRWFYTAITRVVEKLTLLNYKVL